MRASLRVMLSLLDTDKRTQHATVAHCLRRCVGKLCRRLTIPSDYNIHKRSLNEHEETPGTLLEYDGDQHLDSSSDPKEAAAETPAAARRRVSTGV